MEELLTFIREELPEADQQVAEGVVLFLHQRRATFTRDLGYWKNKIYYWIEYQGECICFIAIRDPEEPENRWTVWSEDMGSQWLAADTVSESVREVAWDHVDHCGNCGSCGGGREKVIFGKTFDDVCGCTFRFDNPTREMLPVMKKLVDIRIQEIEDMKKGDNQE